MRLASLGLLLVGIVVVGSGMSSSRLVRDKEPRVRQVLKDLGYSILDRANPEGKPENPQVVIESPACIASVFSSTVSIPHVGTRLPGDAAVKYSMEVCIGPPGRAVQQQHVALTKHMVIYDEEMREVWRSGKSNVIICSPSATERCKISSSYQMKTPVQSGWAAWVVIEGDWKADEPGQLLSYQVIRLNDLQ